MKIKIKNIYGIRGKESLTLDSEDKKNMIVFAPNGIGKTSIYKGIKEIYYGSMTNKNEEFLNFFKNDKEINFKESEFIFINNENKFDINDISNNIKNVLSKNIKTNDNNIENFWNKIWNECNNNFFPFQELVILGGNENKVKLIIEAISKFLKNETNENLEEIENKIKSINEISNIVSEINIKEKENPGISKIKNIKDCIEIGEKIENPKSEEEKNLLDAYIIKYIKDKKGDRSSDFAYLYQENYISISDPIIDSKILKKALENYSKNELNLIFKVKELKKIVEKNKNNTYKSTPLKSFEKRIRKLLEELYNKKLALIIQKHKVEFKEIKNEFDQKNQKKLDKINDKIRKINIFFNKESLDWKIKMNNIKSIYDKIDIKIWNDDSIDAEFDSKASTGQKSILFLISQIISLYGEKGVVVMDDAFSSLDNQHTNEFIEVISDKNFKDVNFLILTHNFEWLRSFAFNKKISQKSQFIVFDKINKNEFVIFKSSYKEISQIMNISNLNEKLNKEDLLIRIVSFSNIIRETFFNDLFTKKIPIRGLICKEKNSIEIAKKIESEINKLTNEEQKFLKVIEFFDQYIRHYKGNMKTTNLLEKFEEKIGKNDCINHIPIILIIKDIIDKINKKYQDKIFGNIIKEKEISWNKIENIESYVSYKMFFGIKVRFKMEYNKFYKFKEEGNNIKEEVKKNLEKIIEIWEDENKWNLANLEIKELESEKNNITPKETYKINYLAHANQKQWNKIIEFPIYKLKKVI